MNRRLFFLAVVAAVLNVTPAWADSPPTLGYCEDTLHGTAGSSFIDDDNEIRWQRLNFERSTGKNVSYNTLSANLLPGGNNRVVQHSYYTSGGTLVGRKYFECNKDWIDPVSQPGFWDYNDYPSGFPRTGWYD